jgi:predicted Zn-dependent protease
LIQHTNGRLYGDTAIGGTAGDGVFYSYDVGLQSFVTFLPAGGRVGAQIEILGQDFTGTTAVSVNGVPAKFAVRLSTYLTATVPNGATSGYITIATPSGTLKSNRKFLVWLQIVGLSGSGGYKVTATSDYLLQG